MSLSRDEFWLLFFVGLFILTAFGGVCYAAGRKAAEADQKQKDDERISDLKAAGYDPTPHYDPIENIDENSD